MKRTSELFSILLTLALLLGLAPWATVPARAEAEPTEITNQSYSLPAGKYIVKGDVTLDDLTLGGNVTIEVPEGKSLTINDSVVGAGNYDDYTITITGGGKVKIHDPDGDNSVKANLVAKGCEITLVGEGVPSYGWYGDALAGNLTLAGGSVTLQAGPEEAFGGTTITVEEGYTYAASGTAYQLEGGKSYSANEANQKFMADGAMKLVPAVAKRATDEGDEYYAELADALLPGGDVTLLADVTIDAPLTIPSSKTVILDLNGHTIDRGLTGKAAAEHGNVIEVNGTLTLKDSVGTGKITGGNNENNTGGGVYVDNDAAFTMTGGRISENQVAGSGGGVYVVGSFTMTGGTITDNNATGLGGGVCVAEGATFNVSGTPVISRNFTKGIWDNDERYVRNDENPGSAADDVHLTQSYMITVTGALTDGASIYVNADASERAFATGSNYQIRESDAKYFHSDTDEKLVGALDNGNVKLVSASVSGEVTGAGKLTYAVIAPAGAKLIAARYDGGRMTAVTVVNVTDAAGTLTLGGTGDEYRLFLVDGATSAPLCAAWSNRQ